MASCNSDAILWHSDLIRHGKNHAEKPVNAHDRDASQAQRNREREQRAHEQQLAEAQAKQRVTQKDLPSPNYRREAELIVQEEKEAKAKMPVYKGLEKYTLLEKMGEYVAPFMFSSSSSDI